MKVKYNKFGFVLIIVTLVSSNVSSQSYNRLLGTTNQWNISSSFEGCGTFTSFTVGDTSILGINYFKLFCSSCGVNNDSALVALIREDTVQRKVFLRRYGYPNILDSTEFLYFDFSLTLGDSVFLNDPNINRQWSQFSNIPLDWYYVDSTTLVNTNVGNRTLTFLRKRNLLLNEYDYLQWVEGIGAVYGFYIYNCGVCWSWLDCEFKDGLQQFDGSQFFPVSPDNECVCNTIGVNEVEQKDLVSIYPNPVNSTLSIELPNIINENSYLKVYSIYGDLKKCYFQINRNSIDVSSLSKGIYFIEMDLGGVLIQKPFVKM